MTHGGRCQARAQQRARVDCAFTALDQWPEIERAAWQFARTRGCQRLSRGGPASRLCEEASTDLVRRYGQFLNYFRRTQRPDNHAQAGALVTPEAIAGFIEELQIRVRSVTVAQSIYKVYRAATLIAPERDFSWLAEIAKDLALVAEPMNKSSRIVATERLVEAGLTLVAEAGSVTSRPPLARALATRNGLMIAIIALCPIRLKNFAALAIGQSFVEQEGTWWIVLRKTKSKRSDERPLPKFLNRAVRQYLEVHRPVLLRDNGGNIGTGQDTGGATAPRLCNSSLWIGRLGFGLSRIQIRRTISATTRTTLGVDISPHLVRACAATTAALYAADKPHLASALLQHTDRAITDGHYNRANSLSVAQRFARLVRNL